MPSPLISDRLDRRIIGALQVDGRASWRRIAEVLGEPERTVARRGVRLLESNAVVVTGLAARGEAVLVRMRSSPGTTRVGATALAQRPDTTFVYTVTGAVDCIAEVICPAPRLSALVLDELSSTPGVTSIATYPVVRYYRTVHEWQPGLLDDTEAAQLRVLADPTPPASVEDPESVGREERLILRALSEDGRRPYEELARIAGMSEPTTRRRLDWLRREGLVLIRAVVEPELLDLPVEALLWVRTSPTRVDEVGEALLSSPMVRYAAAVMGEHQLVIDVTAPDKLALHRFVTQSPWVRQAHSVEASLVVTSLKRSGVLARPLRD